MRAPLELRDAAILLDVDGTILDIASMPDKVRVPASLRRALGLLWQRTGGAVAVVSGRTLRDLNRIFMPLHIPAIGGHGAEMCLLENGKMVRHRPTISLDAKVRRRLKKLAELGKGILIEDKGYSVALHYRRAPTKGAALAEAITRICAELPPHTVEILDGKAVIEVKQIGFDKGTAVRELMTHPPFAGRRPVFVGDDTTDEAAFAVLPDFAGIAISVGRELPQTHETFKSPAEVRLWLERLATGDGVVIR